MKLKEIEFELSDEEHQRLVTFIETLVAKDPPPESPEGTALLLLALIVSEHEAARYPLGDGGPAYDAATRTGMYDHDDVKALTQLIAEIEDMATADIDSDNDHDVVKP